ncbi:hypothetical protein KKD03_04175, partial [Patescibacteria group bacterium]|nr:hypothetical protein [Patescibacteria group bacterium]
MQEPTEQHGVEASQMREVEGKPANNEFLIKGYLTHKFSSDEDGVGKQHSLLRRVKEFSVGSESTKSTTEIADNLIGDEEQELVVAPDMNIDLETTKQNFKDTMMQRMKDVLRGQESKIENADKFISQLSESLFNSIGEQGLNLEEERNLVEKGLQLATMVVEAINYQDLAANAVSLGDHGWSHLTQDMHDSMVIAEGLKREDLSAKEKLMLTLTAAFHDIGYASPQVADQQQKDSKNYSL